MNVSKSKIFPIRCAQIDLQDVLSVFPAKTETFPGKYLGMPLHFRCCCKIDFQPLIDKASSKIPGDRTDEALFRAVITHKYRGSQ